MAKAAAEYGSLPFKEQIEFFRAKLNLPTAHWTDIYTKEHDWAFVVAGATRDALLCDLRAAVEKAINQGTTLEEFRRDFDSIVDKHGWHGWTGEDRKGGKAWRTRTIYETNIATSYAAGRYQQLQHAPLWRYVHADWVTTPRPQHQAWDGLILPKDDPWWNTHFPPNGWGCKCSVQGIWPDELGDFGKDAPDAAPPDAPVTHEIGQRSALGPRKVKVPAGIDPGFEYTPGKARLNSAVPPEAPEGMGGGSTSAPGFPNFRDLTPLPAPWEVPATMLIDAKNMTEEDCARVFLAAFGIEQGGKSEVVFKDVIGERVVVGEALFKSDQGDWKAKKQGRGPYMRLLALTLMHPDEIWARLEWHEKRQEAMVRRRYVTRFAIEGKETPMLVAFELGKSGWTGTTAYQGKKAGKDALWRIGTRIYKREGKRKAVALLHDGLFRV